MTKIYTVNKLVIMSNKNQSLKQISEKRFVVIFRRDYKVNLCDNITSFIWYWTKLFFFFKEFDKTSFSFSYKIGFGIGQNYFVLRNLTKLFLFLTKLDKTNIHQHKNFNLFMSKLH